MSTYRSEEPALLAVDQWALSGDWSVEPKSTTLNGAGDRITYRFRGRDLNLVLGAAAGPVRFVVRLDGEPPGSAQGLDVDVEGRGTVFEARLHQAPSAFANDTDDPVVTVCAFTPDFYVNCFREGAAVGVQGSDPELMSRYATEIVGDV